MLTWPGTVGGMPVSSETTWCAARYPDRPADVAPTARNMAARRCGESSTWPPILAFLSSSARALHSQHGPSPGTKTPAWTSGP